MTRIVNGSGKVIKEVSASDMLRFSVACAAIRKRYSDVGITEIKAWLQTDALPSYALDYENQEILHTEWSYNEEGIQDCDKRILLAEDIKRLTPPFRLASFNDAIEKWGNNEINRQLLSDIAKAKVAQENRKISNAQVFTGDGIPVSSLYFLEEKGLEPFSSDFIPSIETWFFDIAFLNVKEQQNFGKIMSPAKKKPRGRRKRQGEYADEVALENMNTLLNEKPSLGAHKAARQSIPLAQKGASDKATEDRLRRKYRQKYGNRSIYSN